MFVKAAKITTGVAMTAASLMLAPAAHAAPSQSASPNQSVETQEHPACLKVDTDIYTFTQNTTVYNDCSEPKTFEIVIESGRDYGCVTLQPGDSVSHSYNRAGYLEYINIGC